MKKHLIFAFILLLSVIGIIFLHSEFNFVNEESLILILTAFVILAVCLWSWIISRRAKRKLAAFLQEIIPGNVDARSYIDESSGAIFLPSHDYQTRGGQSWSVSQNAVAIHLNSYNAINQTIPFHQIQNVVLGSSDAVGILTLKGLGAIEEYVDPTDWGRRERVISSDYSILFHPNDLHIAEAIRDRVAGN